MSWHCSRVLVAGFLRESSSGLKQSAPLRSTTSVVNDCSNGRTKDILRRFLYGMTSVPLTESVGEELLTWYLAASRAKRSAQQRTGAQPRVTSGLRCSASSVKSGRDSSSQKMSPGKRSRKPPKTVSKSATKQKRLLYPRKTWVLTTFGNGIGLLHTPTCTMNYSAKSMQRHQCCKTFVTVFGRPTPTNQEWLMAWPIGWTASEPLGTDKFRSWLQQHGDCSLSESRAA